MNKEDRIEYLEEERTKILGKVNALEILINSKTTDFEIEARQSAEQATNFKNTSEEAKNNIAKYLEEANSKIQEIRTGYSTFEELSKGIKEFSDSSKENSVLIKTLYDEIQSKSEVVKTQIAEIEKIIENKPAIDEKLLKLEGVFTKGDDYDSKLGILYKSITDRKKEIDELYYAIIGYTEKNEEGVETKVEGLKDQLHISYDKLKSDFNTLDNDLITLRADTKVNFETFQEEKEKTFANNLAIWEEKYSSNLKQIESLLPKALTAGLSYAYSEKKLAEEKESEKFSTTFKWAIGGLIVVSLIPFMVSLNSINNNTAIEQVLLRIPRLVIAILPLYIPVLWVAYSSNRKMNLSKRLIEEYSHKEVLSKTFEGLSKQINNIDDKDVSADLKTKLLYNILEVNSENPGKLISDYNKSDHPLMDALDKSIKLTNAVTKLAKIPGFTKLAAKLEKKSQEILKEESQKADAGLETIETK